MSYLSSVSAFAFDTPVNQSAGQTSLRHPMRKIVSGAPLLYGPTLLLLLAACSNGTNVSNLDDTPAGTDQTEDEVPADNDQSEDEAQADNDQSEDEASFTIIGTDDDDDIALPIRGYTITGLGGHDNISGSAYDDMIDGGAGDDVIYGRFGHDRIEGGSGNDTIYGNDGNDTIHGDEGDDTIYAGAGEDDALYGGIGNDKLYAGPGENDIHGEEGDDTIYAGIGVNIIDGGDGFDRVDYSAASRAVFLFLNDDGTFATSYTDYYDDLLVNSDDVRFDQGGEIGPWDRVFDIEAVILSDHDDQIATDGIAKEFDGGAGTDTLIFDASPDAVTIDLRGGVDADGYYVMAPSSATDPQYDSYEKGTKFQNFERIVGTQEDDTFYGADDADFVFLSGGGDDRLISGKGSVTFYSGVHDDHDIDTVDYSRAEGGITVDLNDLDDDDFVTVTIDHADWKDDKLRYVEDVIGSAHDDSFSGEVDVTNYFTGGAGRDVFYADVWEVSADDDYNYDVVTDFVVGTDKIGFWVGSAILNAYFAPGNENIEGFLVAFGIRQEVNDQDNILIIERVGVTILEIEDYFGTEGLSPDLSNFTLSHDVA